VKVLTKFRPKDLRRLLTPPGLLTGILAGLLIGILAGLFVGIPAGLSAGVLAGLSASPASALHASAPPASIPDPARPDFARMSPAELETLALDVLATLSEKRGGEGEGVPVAGRGTWDETGESLRQIHLGMKNLRRLLPLGKRLTLQALGDSLKTSRLSKERRLITNVRRVVLDPAIGNAACVDEDDLTVIRVGPDYAVYLTSDDDAMLLLGHELTHVAARAGRLKRLIESVSELAHRSADLTLDEEQREELACDFAGAQVLKRYIALHPTGERSAERFVRPFGYEPAPERLAAAWKDFCASYNGDPLDEVHLSWYQTLRVLSGLDPELKALIPDDATSTHLCR
jgi:hypothetical protein